jgi:hypothetical protein
MPAERLRLCRARNGVVLTSRQFDSYQPTVGSLGSAGNWAWGKMRRIRTHPGRQQLTRLSPWITAPRRRIPGFDSAAPTARA